ncbi:IS110 family transposase [Candidatus Midichloria mitochondrii]|nr:transposase [Candidatus Midichloria mitochondrii]
MEATGNDGKSLAQFLHNHGHKVSILNPAQIKYYAKSRLVRAKN